MADVADAKLARGARPGSTPPARARSSVDGGGRAETAEVIGRGGTDVIVAGSALYRAAGHGRRGRADPLDRRRGARRDARARRSARATGPTCARSCSGSAAPRSAWAARSWARSGPGCWSCSASGHGDDEATADALARRICELRIFEDEEGRTNRSLLDVGGRGAGREPVHALRGHAPRPPARVHGRGAARPRRGRCGCGSRAAIEAQGVADGPGRVRRGDGGRARERRPVHDLARHRRPGSGGRRTSAAGRHGGSPGRKFEVGARRGIGNVLDASQRP